MPDSSIFTATFPELGITYNGGKLRYFDTAATCLRPSSVSEAESHFLSTSYANISRGVSGLSANATEIYERARQDVIDFVSGSKGNLIVTQGATSSLNMAAMNYRNKLKAGDEIIVTLAEHHSNLLPWVNLCEQTGAILKYANLTQEARISPDLIAEQITSNTKVIAAAHISNVTGAITPAADIAKLAKAAGADFILDACQSAGHIPVNFSKIGCTMAAFSAHKAYGPTGLGFLWITPEALGDFGNQFTGGGTVDFVDIRNNEIVYKRSVSHFEAGTPPISQLVAFSKSIELLRSANMNEVAKREEGLTKQLLRVLEIPGISVIGPKTAENRVGIISITHNKIHPHDLSQVLDSAGIVCRAGHNCAMPIHQEFGLNSSTRLSLGVYNTMKDVEDAIEAVSNAVDFLVKK